jgi:hypothetical protein
MNSISNVAKPVELLRDSKGIYGVGISDAFDIEALAWACGIDNPHVFHHPGNLILRPDWLSCCNEKQKYRGFAVLQKITGGFRHGLFAKALEEGLRQVVHHDALNRIGLPWPPPAHQAPYWSADKKQQARNRQIYHGLRLGSLHIINKLIGQLSEEAAEPIALKIARRFSFAYRETIYRAGARSRYALQLAETFPVLAFVIYCTDMSRQSERESWQRGDWNQICEARAKQREAKVKEAIALVERGARLRDVAAIMQVPMAMRHIKPGAAHFAGDCHKAEWIISCMPDSLPRMRTWLRAVDYAGRGAGSEFAEWAAKHALRLPVNGIGTFLENTADWVRASNGHDGHQFVVRRFSPDMSLRTVTRLSAEWHDAIASRLDGPQHIFPPPWIDTTHIDGLEIIPINNSADLYREGAVMHHCVGTYSADVRDGRCYVYSIRRNGERLATAAIVRKEGRPVLQQIRGPCDAEVSDKIKAAARRWLRSNSAKANQITDFVAEGTFWDGSKNTELLNNDTGLDAGTDPNAGNGRAHESDQEIAPSPPSSPDVDSEDRTCAQCRGPVDGKERLISIGGAVTVWLHPECERFYLEGWCMSS